MVSATTIYDFTLIADNTGLLHNLGVPSINDSGAVAFQASLTAGGYGVFTGSGGPLTTIVNSNDGVFYTFSLGAEPMINNAGTVAFFGQLNPGPMVTQAAQTVPTDSSLVRAGQLQPSP